MQSLTFSHKVKLHLGKIKKTSAIMGLAFLMQSFRAPCGGLSSSKRWRDFLRAQSVRFCSRSANFSRVRERTSLPSNDLRAVLPL